MVAGGPQSLRLFGSCDDGSGIFGWHCWASGSESIIGDGSECNGHCDFGSQGGGRHDGNRAVQRGFEISVLERWQAATLLGAGIVVWPNASFVLGELGLLPKIAAPAGRPDNMRRISATGQPLGELSLRAIDRAMGYPSYAILRKIYRPCCLTN